MSDLAVNVKWQEILRETESGHIPHSRAIAVPSKYYQEIIESLSRLILGSYRLGHPDLLVIGTTDKAAPIGDPEKPNYEGSSRWLIENIALKPLESKCRLGVVMSADKLLLPAANSLLKLTEEPPDYAYMLFLMEDGRRFLPTLRSRSQFTAITIDDEKESLPAPSSPSELVKWLAETRKGSDAKTKRKAADADSIADTLKAWANHATESGNFVLAERIERLRIIAGRKNLSVPMLCDLIILTLGDDDRKYEYILDDFR